jgi:hypothetical protein
MSTDKTFDPLGILPQAAPGGAIGRAARAGVAQWRRAVADDEDEDEAET